MKHGIALNAISCFTVPAYGGNGKAPGVVEGKGVVRQTVHHARLAYGHGVRAVREHGGRGAHCGLSALSETVIPVSESEDDIAAFRARR